MPENLNMIQNPTTLLIVYNADSGALNAVLHAIHKTLRPQTYPCSLCALTYGMVSMHSKWKEFLASIPCDVVFHHKDDYAAANHGPQPALPAILMREDGKAPEMLVQGKELDALGSLDQLIALVEARLVERLGTQVLVA